MPELVFYRRGEEVLRVGGVFVAEEGKMRFEELGPPTQAQVERLLSRVRQRVETIREKCRISIAASEIARATAMPQVLVSSRRYLVRRAAVTQIVGPRFREIASTRGNPERLR